MNKNQQKNRMGAVIILLAAACLNGYAQQDSTKVASKFERGRQSQCHVECG